MHNKKQSFCLTQLRYDNVFLLQCADAVTSDLQAARREQAGLLKLKKRMMLVIIKSYANAASPETS